jgi:hypothetical protein
VVASYVIDYSCFKESGSDGWFALGFGVILSLYEEMPVFAPHKSDPYWSE